MGRLRLVEADREDLFSSRAVRRERYMEEFNRPEIVPDTLRDVGEAVDEDGYVVGIRETTEPDAWSLLFMEYVDDGDEQEVELGMDTYCLVVDPGQATYYGGVLDWQITPTELRLTLSEAAACTLGMPDQARFRLELSTDHRLMLERGIRRVLASAQSRGKPRPRTEAASRTSGSADPRTATPVPVTIDLLSGDETRLRALKEQLDTGGLLAWRQGAALEVLVRSLDDCARVGNALVDIGGGADSPSEVRIDGPGAEFTYALTANRAEDTRMLSGWLAAAAFLH